MKFDKARRELISQDAKGKTIESMEWDEEGEYWVLTFTDGSEMSVRLMAELV